MIVIYPNEPQTEINRKFAKVINDMVFRISELEKQLASQSAKPGQSIHSCTPCPAENNNPNTPPSSRHPGANDCEV